VHKIGEGQSRTGEKLSGFSAEFVIDRTEFGMNYGEGALGTEVTVHVDVEGIAQ
jgi:polyisoprenoid-binding protein YceI